MPRRLLNLLTPLSLLLCVAVVTLWVCSYGYFQHVRYGKVPLAVRLDSQQGLFRMEWTVEWPGSSYGLITEHKALTPEQRDRGSTYFQRECNARFGQFGWGRAVEVFAHRGAPPSADKFFQTTVVTAPHWAVALPAAALPALWLFRRHRSRSRHRVGFCPACGYDLRATPDRCPECGRGSK